MRACCAGTIPARIELPAGYFGVAFVPERPLPSWYPSRRDRLLGSIFLAAGILFAVANRKSPRTPFLIGGAVACALGVAANM